MAQNWPENLIFMPYALCTNITRLFGLSRTRLNCIISYGIAWYCIVSFGAQAVSRKTSIYFMMCLLGDKGIDNGPYQVSFASISLDMKLLLTSHDLKK